MPLTHHSDALIIASCLSVPTTSVRSQGPEALFENIFRNKSLKKTYLSSPITVNWRYIMLILVVSCERSEAIPCLREPDLPKESVSFFEHRTRFKTCWESTYRVLGKDAVQERRWLASCNPRADQLEGAKPEAGGLEGRFRRSTQSKSLEATSSRG
jgi:hypothetical protein